MAVVLAVEMADRRENGIRQPVTIKFTMKSTIEFLGSLGEGR